MGKMNPRLLSFADQALDDFAAVPGMLLAVGLVGVFAAMLVAVLGRLSGWVIYPFAIVLSVASWVVARLVWEWAGKKMRAVAHTRSARQLSSKAALILGFVFEARALMNLLRVALASVVLTFLAPFFDLAAWEALLGLAVLSALGMLLGPLTRLMLRWVNPGSETDSGGPT